MAREFNGRIELDSRRASDNGYVDVEQHPAAAMARD